MKAKHFTIVATTLLIFGCAENKTEQAATTTTQTSAEKGETIIDPNYLFNGKNLDGWYFLARDSSFTGQPEDIFSIKDGIIHVYPDQEADSEQTFAGIITDSVYSDYTLTLEYKWGEKKFKPRDNFVRDAGVLFHLHGAEEIWPNSVECQIQEGDTGDIWAIGTQVTSTVNHTIRNYDEKGDTIVRGNREKRFDRFHRSYDWENPTGWNSLKIEVRGENAFYYLNGKAVNAALNMKFYDMETDSWQPLTKGRILLQAEGAEIFYRNVKLMTD